MYLKAEHLVLLFTMTTEIEFLLQGADSAITCRLQINILYYLTIGQRIPPVITYTNTQKLYIQYA